MNFNRTLTAAALALAPATLAHAQTGTGSWWWEGSINNGTTWTRGTLEVPQSTPSVLVRARASWSQDAGRWFASAFFDGVIEGAAPADSASNFQSLTEIPFFPLPVASRFGSLLKIDDPRDTLPPGQGDGSVSVAQFRPGTGNATTANPIELFQFELTLDGSLGDRRVSESFLASGSGNTTDRFMLIYTENGITRNRPLVTQRDALTIRVIPAPAAALPIFGVMFLTRCRRRVPTREAPPCSRQLSPHS